MAEWVKPVIDPDRGVILINTDKLYEKDTKNQKLGNEMNQHHANLINCIVSDLLHCGIHSSQIGIIAPYHSQLKLIKNKLTKTQENCLLIETIDRVQGSDRDIVIVSLTHTVWNEEMNEEMNESMLL